jgi:hypothetical protein
MTNLRLDMLSDFFAKHGVKIVDAKTGEEIKEEGRLLRACPYCEQETPADSKRCMWCQNEVK